MNKFAALPTPVYSISLIFCLICTRYSGVFTIIICVRVVFVPRETTASSCVMRCLSQTGVWLLNSWPPPFFTGTSCIAFEQVGPRLGLEASNAYDTHSLALLYPVTIILTAQFVPGTRIQSIVYAFIFHWAFCILRHSTMSTMTTCSCVADLRQYSCACPTLCLYQAAPEEIEIAGLEFTPRCGRASWR